MFAAFHIADLPVVAALESLPEWRQWPCAILKTATDKDDGKIPLLALNAAARDTGIAAGWPLGKAQVRCPNLKLLPRDPQRETALLAALVELADRFSADLEITSPDTVLLDLAGTRRTTFQGLETLPDSEIEVVHAVAETPDLAHFAVLEPRTRGRWVSIAEIGSLPLNLLGNQDQARAILPLLDLLGLKTLADYGQLPRQDLAQRFGPAAAHWHDVITGKHRRLLKLHRPPESLAQSLDFEDSISSCEALVFVFNRLLYGLAARLQARHLAASTLKIHLRLENGEVSREIHLPAPLRDPAALLKPLQAFAESLVLTSPVTALQLDATAGVPLSRQNDWTGRQLPRPERWADTLAQLEGWFGQDRIGIPVPLAGDRPFAMRSATVPAPSQVLGSWPLRDSIPLRRFRPPLSVAVAFEQPNGPFPHPLALLSGPHCGEILEQRGPFPTSGEGWNPDTAWQRLEWDIRLDHAPPLRLVYQPSDCWQLDGIYG
jgi:protein ImuB